MLRISASDQLRDKLRSDTFEIDGKLADGNIAREKLLVNAPKRGVCQDFDTVGEFDGA